MDMTATMPTIVVEPIFGSDGAGDNPCGGCAQFGVEAQEWLEVMSAIVVAGTCDDEAMRELSASTAAALQRGVEVHSSGMGKMGLAYAPYQVSPGNFYILRDSESFVCGLASILLEGVPPADAAAIAAVVEYEYERATLLSGAQQCPAASAQHDRTRRSWRRRE